MKYCLYCGSALKKGNGTCLKCGRVNEEENKYEGFSESKYPNEFYPPVKNKIRIKSLLMIIISALALASSVVMLVTSLDFSFFFVSVALLIASATLISKYKKCGYPKTGAYTISKKLALASLIVTAISTVLLLIKLGIVILAVVLLIVLL